MFFYADNFNKKTESFTAKGIKLILLKFWTIFTWFSGRGISSSGICSSSHWLLRPVLLTYCRLSPSPPTSTRGKPVPVYTYTVQKTCSSVNIYSTVHLRNWFQRIRAQYRRDKPGAETPPFCVLNFAFKNWFQCLPFKRDFKTSLLQCTPFRHIRLIQIV